jgi:branched-chain amino acid transport system substrate-binding protein
MKKTWKKALALTLSVAFAVSAAGCGSNSANSDSYTADNTEFFIGATGPLTGDASSYGISVKQGAQLAIEEINANGGLNGVNFKFDMKDDKAESADAATGYNTLYEAGMNISIGSVTSGSCESFASKAAEDNVFFITPSASAANVIADRSNAFRVCFGDPDQGTLAAKELTSKYEKIGCIYDTSDDYSSGIYAAFEGEMESLGVDFVKQSFDKENNKDFSTQIEALKDCDVIFLPIYYTEAGLIAKTAASKGCSADLFGCDGLDGIAAQIDSTVTASIRYITPFDVNNTSEVSSNFVNNYKTTYGEEPDQFAADGYDAVYAIFYAMQAAGIDDPTISPSDLCDAVVEQITSSDFSYEGATGSMTWDASGACTKDPIIIELQ